MSNSDLAFFSLFIWLVYMSKRLLPIHSMLDRDGKFNRMYLKRTLLSIWLTGLLTGVTVALGLGDYYGSIYILIQRLLGFGVLFPSFAIALFLVVVLRHERENKQKRQRVSSDDANQEI